MPSSPLPHTPSQPTVQNRRFLPETSLLTAFEAAARHGTVTGAASELSLTQSAVSRRIKALEDQLGLALFTRERQRIRLTAAGAAYLPDIQRALSLVSAASMRLATNPDGGVLDLASLSAFGARWLAPRLPRFLASHPGVTVNLSTRLRPVDFAREPLHAAIEFTQMPRENVRSIDLMNEKVAPMCGGALAEKLVANGPSALANAPLLHVATRRESWAEWLAQHNLSRDDTSGMVFDEFATTARAAMSGLGVALLPLFLTETERARGELKVVGPVMASKGSYRLVWPATHKDWPPLMAFREWLQTEAIRPSGGSG